MNYFELYGLPVQMRVDRDYIRKTFYTLSRKYHPDFHTSAPKAEQAEILEKSSLVNKAFEVFQDPDATIRYVLSLHNLIEAEEKYSLSPEFLMEVMDINEQLMEMEPGAASESIDACEQQAVQLLSQINQEAEPYIASYQSGITPEKDLLKVKDYYYRKKYMQRILDKIAQLRNIATH